MSLGASDAAPAGRGLPDDGDMAAVPAWRRPALWAVPAAALAVAAAAAAVVGAGPALVAGLAGLAVPCLAVFAWALGAARVESRAGRLLLGAIEADPAARLLTGPDGQAVRANPAFSRLFPAPARGVRPSLEAMAAALDGPQAEAEFQRLCGSAAAGVGDHAEVPVRLPSGGRGWRALSVVPVRGGRGFSLWTAEDVTARREIEAARRREERMFEDFLDYLPVGFFSADADGRFLYVNQTLASWLGVPPGEGARGRLGLADFVADAGDTGPADGEGAPGSDAELALRGPDGEAFRAYLCQSQLEGPDGAFVYSRSVVLRDVAPGGDRAGALRRWESRERSLFAEAPVGIVLLDLSGEVTECNRSFLRLLGRHRDAVVGNPLADHVRKEDRSELSAQLSKVVMGALPAARMELRLPGPGEREVVASVFASRLQDGDDDTAGLLLHLIDTTERKHLEIQFTQAQKMQAVGQLAGGVAHDFNNLLTAMIGFCDLLLGRHGPGDPSFGDIMQIKQNANRAANLVRQLLAFSRRQTLQPRSLDVSEALSEMSNLLRRLIGETIDLRMEHGRDLGRVRVDPGQFDQVIVNLAVNARDAMPNGGTLGIRTSSVSLDAPAHRGSEIVTPGDYVVIEVTDTGCGIPSEDIERIFEPFFSTKEVGAGTGLGLSTVYGIVRQTGGYVFVDSAPGDGTTFQVYLPRQDEVADAPAAERAEPAPGPGPDLTGRGTVLLVEDEDPVRLFASRALANKGYEVLEAEDAEAALDIVQEFDGTIDLVVSDVVMPGMDGHTLVRFLREERPGIRVILMSGYAEDVVPVEIGADPGIHFLHKPFALKELAAVVKEVMGG